MRHWKVLWNEWSQGAYLSGTRLQFLSRDEIQFQNLLMPSGSVIRRWYSATSYPDMRVEPTLPIIDGEGRYRIDILMENRGTSACFIQIVYFDRYGKEISSLIVKEPFKEFRCPMSTYNYEIRLVSAGRADFTFHYMTITELDQ